MAARIADAASGKSRLTAPSARTGRHCVTERIAKDAIIITYRKIETGQHSFCINCGLHQFHLEPMSHACGAQ
jgi:hypothetical protein